MDHGEIINKRVRRIARDHGCSVADVNAALDRHPIELDRDTYLKRTLAMELVELDELQAAFREKACGTAMSRGQCGSRGHCRQASGRRLPPEPCAVAQGAQSGLLAASRARRVVSRAARTEVRSFRFALSAPRKGTANDMDPGLPIIADALLAPRSPT